MKKILYSVMITIITSLSIIGCTEQEIKPKGGVNQATVSDPTGPR